MTLVEFLTARAAEREERAECIHDTACGMHRYDGPCDCGEPERVRAEADALRRIIAEVWHEIDILESYWGDAADDLLKLLALPFATHPDYEEAVRS